MIKIAKLKVVNSNIFPNFLSIRDRQNDSTGARKEITNASFAADEDVVLITEKYYNELINILKRVGYK